MRRILILLISLIAFGGLVPVAGSVPSVEGCTKIGTKDGDILTGNPDDEKFCSLGGPDNIHTNGGNDIALGGSGRDTIVGGGGRDRIRGEEGSDKLFSIDQISGNDIIRAGTGKDSCFADPGDILRGCERVSRGNGDRTTRALSSSFLGVAEIGEEALEDQVPACPSPADEASAC
jgi:Ca2+-binding RTX toxin-like protein